MGGGGCGRGVVEVVVGGFGTIGLLGFGSEVEVVFEVGEGENGVRRSDWGIMGKEAVEKR